uniref:Rif1_N domain-containing protein n=1 Tax=Anopheles atroparvus TaxID=41427 RepID=A0A182JCJ0_ANOAO
MNTTPHTRKMASLMHLMDGQKYYEPLRAALQQENLPEVNRLLCELETVCRKIHVETTNGTSDGNFTTNQNELKFWLIDVARLMLEEKSACTRRLALKALEAAVPLLVKSNYQELPVWAEVRTTISRDYTSLLDTARSEKDPHWHQMWAALVRVMNRDLCQGSSIINMFLSIVEAGFRCPELSIREQSFDCWRLLVEVFSNNKQMNLPKRMKLICIPLKSSKSKTETIALKKFDIWWYLLNELSPHLDGLADTIFEPFIYFCFGPSFKPPLCYYFDDSFQEYGAPGKIKSEEIIKHVFDLQRYSKQKGYWEMLQKTIQYLCETDGDNGISEFRTIRTQIYRHLGSYLIVQIHADPAGFAEHQSTVMGFLLYPLEYDQLVFIESVRSLWDEVYEPIALQEGKSCEFTNTFCEMIKAMTIAKFAFNLGVVADFFCTILRSLSPEFDSNKPPMKVFELFKDLTRKAQAYQANLNRVENMVSCFRELLEKMSITNMLTLILPIRNAINEMASNEQGLAMEEVKRTLNVVASKMVLSCMASELVRQPKEVQWNCKMLLSMMLELPADVKKGWKQADMRSCMDICDGKETKTPTRKKVKEEFVVIESNWKFKPEVLTDHQREKMMEKRTDIPALYNDMSQSQDSFVIKPWTPNKKHEPVRQERLTMDIVTSSVDTVPMTPATECLPLNTAEIVVPESVIVESTSEEDDPKAKAAKRPDKENNYGNVLPEQVPFVKVKEEVVGSENEGMEQSLVENRTGLGSPKVARYSPLVVLEPMKDYIAVVKGDTGAISGEKAAEQKDVATSAIPSVDSTEQVNSGQAGTTDQLSPVKNLDEEMEPLNKSLNRSIVSSPDLVNAEERNADLLNSTLNISPIAEEKGECAKAPDGSVLAGSADRRPSSRSMVRERDPSAAITPVQMPTMSRRTKPSPSQVLAASNSGGLKALRNQQNQPSSASSVSVMGTPRSPSTNMINLGGRGAQLINLIRQSPNPSTPPQNASTPKEGQSAASANRLMMRKKAITTSAASATHEANAAPSAIKQGEENQGTTQYLVFSKVLPSPQASPASSILKRRHNVDDSCDDIELPVNKRKRVSFHDPPVSVTKEYIRQVEECRSPSISRCLQLATSMSSADKAKYMMRRRSKSDSISELQNFTKDQQSEEPEVKTNTDAQGAGSGAADVDGDDEELTSSPESLDESQFMIHDATDNMPTLQVTAELMHVEQSSSEHESALVNGNAAGNSKSASPEETSEHEVSGGLRFPSEEAVLEHVLQRYALDDIVERYLAAGQTLEHGKTVRMLTKELSSVMSKDPKTRHLVLDELSERHSVEFLEHAIQENSSAMVCERLSLTAMIDHIFKHLRSDCDGGAVASGSPSTMLDEKDNDSLRLVQRIYEMLSNLPNIESNGQTLTMLRDRFLREELGRRTRLEMMDLLEAYFKSIDRT